MKRMALSSFALISLALSSACLYKSEMRWESERRDSAPRERTADNSATSERGTREASPPRTSKQAAARTAFASDARIETRRAELPVALPSPRVRGTCARALIAVREPQSSTGAWGKTDVVTFVEMEELAACPAADASPTDARQRLDLAIARNLSLKEGAVIALDEATDWALGTDDGGNTWRSRTFTAIVEKRRLR